ncbi:hypothetical protein SEUCBS139899_002863 [Sporothrix eucalyptigena]|uniref:Uncharacterized protein n=1 Tax=Sporothrix eucalyptigena TaxID=1812306 RepID=A0ABP0BWX2_9PEZI
MAINLPLLAGVVLATPAVANVARRYNYLEPNATSVAVNGTGGVFNPNATATGYPSTSTQLLTTTVTAISRPPGTLLSIISMITTRQETTYIPGPVTGPYPATITETVVSTGTIEHRRTSSNGKSTTLHAKSTATWQVTLTIQDPNPPPPDTTDFTFPYPFFTPDPTDTGTDGDSATGTDATTTTDSGTAVVTPPPSATTTATSTKA